MTKITVQKQRKYFYTIMIMQTAYGEYHRKLEKFFTLREATDHAKRVSEYNNYELSQTVKALL